MKTFFFRLLRLSPAALVCATTAWFFSPGFAAVVTSTWNNSTGNWNDAARWSPAGFPNNNITDQFNAIFGGGSATLTQAITLNQLTQSGGTITGDFDLTILSPATLSGGVQSGAATTTLQAASSLAGNVSLDAGRILRNANALTWTSGQINLNGNNGPGSGTIANAAGATFTASGNGATSLLASNFGGTDTGASAAFNNAGSFVKSGSGAASTTSVAVQFNNTGAVNVQTGVLALNNGGAGSGSFTAAAGATLDFGGGTHTLTGSLGGAGTIETSSGTVNFNGVYNVTGTTSVTGGTFNLNSAGTTGGYTQTGGTLEGPGNLTVLGAATLSGGTQAGAGTTTLQAASALAGNVNLDAGRILRNENGLTWTSGQINLNGNNGPGSGTLVNVMGATFTASGNGATSLLASNFGGTETGASAAVDNAGIFVKSGSGAANTTSVAVQFNNTGAVNVQTGVLALNSGGTSTGSFAAAAGATLDFGGGIHTLTGSVGGTGTIETSSGTVNFTGVYNVTGTTSVTGGLFNLNSNGTTAAYNQTGGTIDGSGNLTVTGTTNFSGGTQAGAGTTTLQGAGTLAGNVNLDAGRTLRNESALTWTSGQINLNGSNGPGSGTFLNAAGATFTAAGNSATSLLASNFGGTDNGGSAAFNNAGNFVKSGSGNVNTTSIAVQFNNTGAVGVETGVLALNNGGTSSGSFTTSAGATLDFGGGTHTLTGPIGGAGAIETSGGTVNSSGIYNVPGTTRVTGGTFNLNSNGTTGGYAQSGGVLDGTGNLTVTGPATLSGGLMANAATTSLQGVSTIAGNFSLDSGRTLRNENGLAWTSGQINLNGSNGAGSGTILNVAGATFTSGSGSNLSMVASNFGGTDNGTTAAFINQGTFLKTGASGSTVISNLYNSTGTTDVQAGVLTLSGPVTQHVGASLTGGTWIVRDGGTLNLTVAGAQNITTNQGDVTLRGAGSIFTRIDSLTDNQGAFRVLDNRNFTAVGAFANSGELQVGGGAFNAPSLNNAATGNIHGNGTIGVRPVNSGAIRAEGGTLTLVNGIQAAGTNSRAESAVGATLSVSGGASGSTAAFLANNGTLNVGSNAFTVDRDYTNANFGVGNSFNARANVTGSGPINASGNTAQAITGAAVTGGATAAATLGLGNLREGQTVTQNFSVANVGSSGADLRGAIQTSVNGGNLTDARLSGTGVTAGNFGPLAAGAGQSYSVTFNGANAGALSGQQVAVVNNFDNLAEQTLQFTGAVYRAAQANTIAPNPVNLGNVHVGGTLSTSLGITNVAGNTGGFTETLGATVTGTTGGVAAAGSIAGLSQGTSSNAISAGFNTATAGARSGTATIGFTSTEVGGSGLGTIAAGSQTVTLNAGVYRLAEATLGTLSFGNVLVGSSQTRFLNVSNTALADLFSEGLNASLGAFSGTSAGLLSGAGGITNLAAGASNNSTLAVTLNTSASGTVTASVLVVLASNGAGTSGLGITALPSQSVPIDGSIQVGATVGNLASASAATPNPVNLGNVRVGDSSPVQALSLTNTAVGPAEGLNASIGTSSPGLTATGSFNGLAAGASNATGLMVGMNTATAGAKSGTATIALTSDGTFNNGVATNLSSQSVAVNGAVYRIADGTVVPSLVINAREGSAGSVALNVSNTATADGFSEGLRANAGLATGGASISGATGLIAAGGAANSGITIGINTATTGAKVGTATVTYQSDGTGTSGLAAIAAGSDTINVSGSVYRAAAASALPAAVNLGIVRSGTVVDTALALSNIAGNTGGFTEALGASFGASSSGLAGSGVVAGLGVGDPASSAMSVRFTAGAAGAFSGSAAVNFASQEINGSGLGTLALGSQTVNFNATVNALASLGISNAGAFAFTSTGANAALLDFGTLFSPALLTTSLNLLNLASGPADSLLGAFDLRGLSGTPFNVTGSSAFELAAGAGSPFQLNFNPTAEGLYTGTIVLDLSSHNSFQSDLALNHFTLTVRGQLGNPGPSSSVPDSSNTAFLLVVGLLGIAAVRHRPKRAAFTAA